MSIYHHPGKSQALDDQVVKVDEYLRFARFFFIPADVRTAENISERNLALCLKRWAGVERVYASEKVGSLESPGMFMGFDIPLEETGAMSQDDPICQPPSHCMVHRDSSDWYKSWHVDQEEFRSILVCNLQDMCADGESYAAAYRRWRAVRFLSPLHLFHVGRKDVDGKPYWSLQKVIDIPADFPLEKGEVVIADILSEPVVA